MGARHYHLPFSPGYDFVVDKPMTIQGREYQRGEVLDKTPISDRLLRQMYEQRRIRPAGFEDGPRPAYLENGRGVADKIAQQLANEAAAEDQPELAAPVIEPPPRTRRAARAKTAAA